MVVSSRVLAHPDSGPSFEALDDLELEHDLDVEVVDDRDHDHEHEDDHLDIDEVVEGFEAELVGEGVGPYTAGLGPRVGARKRGKFVAELDEHQLLDALAA